MEAEQFYDSISQLGIDFFTGVPDSQLNGFCNLLRKKHGISEKHIVCVNEGAAIGLAAGHYLATKKIPLIYMQNSGIGNAINPLVSLANEKVYDIPMLLVIGWRGEPGVKDEPQHIYQGEITLDLLRCLKIEYIILDKEMSVSLFQEELQKLKEKLDQNKQVAIVVRKDAIEKVSISNNSIMETEMTREKAIEVITRKAVKESVFVSTTGKASRELFEIREKYNESHETDFLTVGSMGHSSMIALGIALEYKKSTVYCIDGDGALLMHMGSMGTIGQFMPQNYVHILLNNGAHETVGGMPTVINRMDVKEIAYGAGYKKVISVNSEEELAKAMQDIKAVTGPVLLEVLVNLESRKDLGRPTTTPKQNKDKFMKYLTKLEK